MQIRQDVALLSLLTTSPCHQTWRKKFQVVSVVNPRTGVLKRRRTFSKYEENNMKGVILDSPYLGEYRVKPRPLSPTNVLEIEEKKWKLY
jgi:hypothetical protein